MVAMLTRPTLVLNRNWQPVGFASVARSLTLAAAVREWFVCFLTPGPLVDVRD